MKSQGNFESFLVGHHLSYIGSYFEQVLLAERLATQNDETCQQHSMQMIEKLKTIGPNFSHRIRFVQQQVTHLQITPPKAPTIPPQNIRLGSQPFILRLLHDTRRKVLKVGCLSWETPWVNFDVV